MKYLNTITIIIMIIVILILFYSYTLKEGMIDTRRVLHDRECPNKIIHKADGIYLYNLRKPIVPGTNPVKFKHLDEYLGFIKMLRQNNIRCPILYYKETTNEGDYQMIPSLSNMMPYLPQKINRYDAGDNPNSPYNKNMYPSFDPLNQYIGSITPLDTKNASYSRDSAMDDDWEGSSHTEKSIERGDYKDDEVFIRINNK
jgi:hypothetical protein